MAEKKKCKQCNKEFTVTDEDLAFLEKISPEFNGKKYLIPPSNYCEECRNIRRYCWRNERNLYKRKCDLSGETIISVYSPDKPFTVYSNPAFKSDKWDPMSYGRDFDFNQGFFEQIQSFMEKVPRQANNTIFNENCDYCNQTWHSKDSYMSFNLGYGERCFYNNEAFYVKDCVDVFDVKNCEFCYMLFDCSGCHSCSFLEHCKDCSQSHFSYNCAGCQNVVLSTGLKNKQYYIRNKQYSKEEYFELVDDFKMHSRTGQKDLRKEFGEIKKTAIYKPSHNLKSENCSGDYIIESKNCHDCYNIFKSENCFRVGNIDADGKDCRDQSYIAEAELCYEGVSISGYHHLFCVFMGYGQDNIYCNFCDNCKNCFGCVGLRRKEYCILNKQYSKDEYEKKVAEIVSHMQKTEEWGEPFPPNISIFAYNESVAQVYYPKTKEEAQKLGAYWQDNNYEDGFTGDFYQPKDDILDYAKSEEETKKLIGGVIKCENSGRPFKVLPQELSFYIKNNIPIPVIHYSERYKELFALRNPRVLYKRRCDCEEPGHGHEGRCTNEFETTYAPDRPEKVYCEECYNKTIL
jgi:hypothetical protein